MTDRLRVALVGGPMYDALYEPFLDDGRRRRPRRPPDAEPSRRGDAEPRRTDRRAVDPRQVRTVAVAVAHSAQRPGRHQRARAEGGGVVQLPRCSAVRATQHRRPHPVVADRPHGCATADVGRHDSRSDAVFGFTGRESGLFGLFFELVTAVRRRAVRRRHAADAARRRPPSAPSTRSPRWRHDAPADLPDWHYDQVDRALLDGRVDCAAAWPGGYDAIAQSSSYRTLRSGACIPAASRTAAATPGRSRRRAPTRRAPPHSSTSCAATRRTHANRVSRPAVDALAARAPR